MKDSDLTTKTDVTDDLTREKLTKVVKDVLNSQDIENLKKWYSDYIDYFRDEYGKLTDDEKKCVTNSKNFLDPCQIEIFWIKNPIYQMIVQSNLTDRKDKDIIIHGPYSTNDFLEQVRPVLREERWQKKSKEYLEYQNEETFLSHQLASVLNYFVEDIKREQFSSKFNVGYTMGRAIDKYVWIQHFRGNIATTDLKKDVELIITEIKNEAKRRKESPSTPPATTTRSQDKYDGYGVHLFPPVIVGKKTKQTPEQLLYGNTFDFTLNEKAFHTKFDDKIIIVNKDGYLFIESKQKTESLKILNLIMALGQFHDLPLYSVKEHELSQASFNKQTIDIGGMTWTVGGSIRSYLFEERFEKQTFEINKKTIIEKEKLEEIIQDARIIIKFEKLSEELRLFNEANTHLANSEYAQSFIMSWSVIERTFSDLWRKKIDQKDVDEERLGKLTNPSQWSVDFILEVLNLGGEIDDDSYDLLMELKKKRNRFYHRGKQVVKEDAERCLGYAHRILIEKISDAKKGLPE